MLLLIVLAKLGGEDKPLGIAEWIQHRCQILVSMLQLQRVALPCHSTYRLVLQKAIDVQEMEQTVSPFLAQKIPEGQGTWWASTARRCMARFLPVAARAFICWQLMC